jgi:hypothetical protein
MIHLNAYIVDIPADRFEELHDAIIEAIEALGGAMWATWQLPANVTVADTQDEPDEVPHEA